MLQLRRLKITVCGVSASQNRDPGSIEYGESDLPCLHQLEIPASLFTSACATTTLEALVLDGTFGVNRHITSVLSNCKNLTSLKLDTMGAAFPKTTVLTAGSIHLPHLRSLVIYAGNSLVGCSQPSQAARMKHILGWLAFPPSTSIHLLQYTEGDRERLDGCAWHALLLHLSRTRTVTPYDRMHISCDERYISARFSNAERGDVHVNTVLSLLKSHLECFEECCRVLPMSDVSVDLPHAFLFEYSRTGMPSLFNGLAHLRLLTRIEISPRTCGSSFVGLFLHSCATAPESARPGNITLVWKLLFRRCNRGVRRLAKMVRDMERHLTANRGHITCQRLELHGILQVRWNRSQKTKWSYYDDSLTEGHTNPELCKELLGDRVAGLAKMVGELAIL
ncbi:hypothetical protein BD311DRAFT_277865 [Dichomitus squalens]|uniref:F-box domain-containing protein n=1 Tax=Dichomitus squalens TaxID=114155 RepID=A0A4Q9MP75_9APHY|nr:hypothetical protein BD311DRAFT_277865 [Dichomitus squalens]